ncbi:MAG: hypothetical protein AAGB03_00025 [Pseudomonadota bacterium]
MNLSFVFSPMIPGAVLGVCAVAMVCTLGFALMRGHRAVLWRTLTALGLFVLLANPSIQTEERVPIQDVVAIVVDRSPSQRIGERLAIAEEAAEQLVERLSLGDEFDVRLVDAGRQTIRQNTGPTDEQGASADSLREGTRLFSSVRTALADVHPDRLAGVLMLTDGQVHDVPETVSEFGRDAPFHALLTGDKDERDRKLTIEKAPRFGIVGNEVEIDIRIDDYPEKEEQTLAATRLFVDGKQVREMALRTGDQHTLTYVLEHGGQSVVEVEVEAIPDEITLTNNRTAIVTNGVRDRLRVLLVSGEPYAGERTWRNLLKADPSVDLVHFTILRPPEKQDGTPISELSLIAFPTRELFSNKLEDFDLIVFDRYQQRGVLPVVYLGNIAKYVEDGGAVLTAAGPAYAASNSLYRTPLAAVLPAKPSGRIVERGFRPEITDLGDRHPVTTQLEGAPRQSADADTDPNWGRWFRLIDTEVLSGNVLMEGPQRRPLLVLDRVGEGRIAQLNSDQSWLWARGFDGGGPQAELLRRLAHWLMKEPDLEEERLSAEAEGNRLLITRRTMKDAVEVTQVTAPDGTELPVTLSEQSPGLWQAELETDQLGLYRIAEGPFSTVAVVGPVNPLEYADARTTEENLKPLADATRGGVFWVAKDGSVALPALRDVRAGRDSAGSNWLGLRRNNQYTVQSTASVSLLNPWLFALALLAAFLWMWRREGR